MYSCAACSLVFTSELAETSMGLSATGASREVVPPTTAPLGALLALPERITITDMRTTRASAPTAAQKTFGEKLRLVVRRRAVRVESPAAAACGSGRARRFGS